MVTPQGKPRAPFYAASAATNQTASAAFGQTTLAATNQAAPAATNQAALAATNQAALVAMNPAATYTAPPVGQPGHAGAPPAAPTGPAYRPPPSGFDQQAVKRYMENMGATAIYRFCLGCGQEADLEHRHNFQHCPGPCWRCYQVHTGTVCSTWDKCHTKSWWSHHCGTHPNHLNRPGAPLEHIGFAHVPAHVPQDRDQGHGLTEVQRALGNIARENIAGPEAAADGGRKISLEHSASNTLVPDPPANRRREIGLEHCASNTGAVSTLTGDETWFQYA